jgi:2-polyprenyl-3-methyl-5-hydroxy-6-metoxy-1,4-benzoquinol methylase
LHASLDFLTAPAGEALLARLAADDLRESNHLRLLTHLRREYPPEHVRAALELAVLRQQAIAKFGPDAARLYFTRAALEQASDPLARAYRAGRLTTETQKIQRSHSASALMNAMNRVPADHAALSSAATWPLRLASATSGSPSPNSGRRLGGGMIDACCSIGADSLALAAAGWSVHGLDRDPERVALARLNAAALGLTATFAVADVGAGLPPAEAVFFDPARRSASGQRIHDVEGYEPPLSLMQAWSHPLVAVKLSPGVDLDQLAGYPGEVEFISVNGDLKEAVLWRVAGLAGLRATRLTAGGVLTYHNPSREPLPPAALSEPRGWLVEPDPAILRAGLVGGLAADLNGWQLDATIAYITTADQPASDWVRAWRVRDWLPFNLKRLKAYLRERRIGQVTVKRRGFPMTPEELLAALRPKGENSATLVMTRCTGQPIVIVCDDLTPEQTGGTTPADEKGDTY